MPKRARKVLRTAAETLSGAAFQTQSALTAKLGWTAQFNEARVTSEQRRNVMACRKLAQQRVLRIMQQQSAEQATRMASERVRDCEGTKKRDLSIGFRTRP